jgi:hypothetical protein
MSTTSLLRRARAYPRNSPQAAARLVALALIANGQIKACEWSILYETQARERLGLRGEEWHAVVDELCADLLSTSAGEPHCEIDPSTLAAWFAEVNDLELQCLVMRLTAAVVCADGGIDEGELAVLHGALQHWVLPAEEQQRLEPIVYGLDFQIVPRDRLRTAAR